MSASALRKAQPVHEYKYVTKKRSKLAGRYRHQWCSKEIDLFVATKEEILVSIFSPSHAQSGNTNTKVIQKGEETFFASYIEFFANGQGRPGRPLANGHGGNAQARAGARP